MFPTLQLFRIDFDEKIGFHINYEGGKGEVYEHCLIRTNAFIEDKYEYWIALNKNYQIPYPIFQKYIYMGKSLSK